MIFKWLQSIFKKKSIVPTDGMVAYNLGFLLRDNPFPKNSAYHSIWRDDWLFATGRFR